MTLVRKTSARSELMLSFVMSTTMLLMWMSAAGAEDAKQMMFERVFGEAARLDPALVARVKALPPGRRLLIDRDGDGKNDEAWYIDTAARHTISPILVRAIDEDGDLDEDGGPDLDSDLYLADWHADGKIDAVVDYQDNDGDGDVDEMSWGSGTFRVLAVDVGDDNLLWYDVNWSYSFPLCAYRCHFSGDEWFAMFRLTPDSDIWVPTAENPFLFYDPDRDGSSEVAIRILNMGEGVESMRYSFDADGDAYGRRAYDYDFSISAIPRGSRWMRTKETPTPEVKIPDDDSAAFRLHGIPTQRVLRWEAAPKFAQEAGWAKACLTWDEMNANVCYDPQQDSHERWEGVICNESKAKSFPQVGGPPCSKLNTRVEVSLKPVSPLRLYYDPTDHRLHLLGANEGYIDVDFNLDGKADAYYTYVDDDQDGVLDRRRMDLDGDGEAEFDWKMKGNVRELGLEYESISAFYKQELAKVLDESQRFIDAAKAALGNRLSEPDPVAVFFLSKLQDWYPVTQLGSRVRSTPAGARYYTDLLRDRLLHRLKQVFGDQRAWEQVEAVYAAGDYAAAAELVLKELAPAAQVVSPARFQSFTHRIPLRIDNSGGGQRDNWPVVLSVKSVQAVAGDFNPENCAVVAPDRWIDWLEIPHQVDQIDASVGKELSFLVDVPAGATDTCYVYYRPTGRRSKSFARRTGAIDDWMDNVGWESTCGAYRAYDGQFDFFGKQQYKDGKKVEWLIYPIGDVNYHHEADWGIDALLVGKTSGIGGLTLYLGDRAYPVQNPGGEGNVKFTRRVLTSGPIRAAVEITASNVFPDKPDSTVQMVCIIYAEHPESEVRAVAKGFPETTLLAPGLTRLSREKMFLDKSLGCLGAWGRQDDGIGEVGLGLIVPPEKLQDVAELADERRLRCEASDDGLRYWIIGDWRRGRRFPIAPTIDNWRRELQTFSDILRHEVRVTTGSPQELP